MLSNFKPAPTAFPRITSPEKCAFQHRSTYAQLRSRYNCLPARLLAVSSLPAALVAAVPLDLLESLPASLPTIG
ncbi:hypothetical protein BOTBODRAFT_402482 [Botryobasidium botryosum FD-172 SS1]|uniref:Uncharacterized protein n=1 Tax=Botryobasidium botryosum (strain FD-172 SS1) TaxID=930990 RepID=A0A067MMH5_BOTB1|nr:hypothetical protein BOTBODRAFT_402482 [Botryobasidium botryosum FD-172 SS1]